MSKFSAIGSAAEGCLRALSPQAEILGELFATGTPVWLKRGSTCFLERHDTDHLILLQTGLCSAIKRTIDGQQQNVAIYVPGDVLGHEAFTLGAPTSTVVTITPATGRRLSISDLRDALKRDGRSAEAFWHFVAFQGALGHEWLLGVGRRPAFERTAHLLCELVWRLRAIGQGSGTECVFPLTQSELSDILGLSAVHVNRTLQRLRQTGYVNLERGRLKILDWPRLAGLAGFQPAYLDMVTDV